MRAALVGLLVAIPIAAQAQDRLDLQIFRPAIDSKGYVTLNGSQVLGPGDVSFGLVTTWGRDVLRTGSTAIDNILAPQLQAAVGVTRRLELGIGIPLAISGGSMGAYQSVGDLALSAKFRLLPGVRYPVGVALVGQLLLPTGDTAHFFGEDQVIVQPQLVVDKKLGRFGVAANIGARIRPNDRTAGADISSGTEMLWGAGAAFSVVPQRFDVVGELWGAMGTSGQRNRPAEADAGVKLYLAQNSFFELGGGISVVGDSSYGAASGGRLFVGFIYEPQVGDRDGDGIPDDIDLCPDDPEDRDGFEDEDGCPDPDNDHDGILDVDDRCPNEPETKNGFQDEDGCPDEVILDRDGDGIPDKDDKCPDDPEDKDGYQDADGCPDLDNDGDGVLDVDDLCPMQPGPQDNAGCPESIAAKKIGGKIYTMKPIFFETDKDTIKAESFPTLDAVASLMKSQPQLEQVEIQAHADERSSDAHNMDLTERRAHSVMRYLIEHGVEPDRLRARGFGETRPKCREHTESCWAQNRRVDFVILNDAAARRH